MPDYTLDSITRDIRSGEDPETTVRLHLSARKLTSLRAARIDEYCRHRNGGGMLSFDDFAGAIDVVVTDDEVRAYMAQHYADMRKACYPPLSDMADAMVKGDETALAVYKNACRAVKERFPKPC